LRPRERYAHDGPQTFGDADLIALVLGTGTPGRSPNAIAAALLERFEGLGGLTRAQVPEIAQVPGVGPVRAIRLHAALEAGRRSLRAAAVLERPVSTAHDAWTALGPPLQGLPDEELHALYLDRRRRPLARRRLTQGSDAFTVVDPRQVFRPAIGLAASAVILAHNHPSGDPTPSPQDRDVTRRVAAAGKVLGIALLDHLVVGAIGYCSLAEEGALPPWHDEPTWTA
jgi:DNA repair protein RadC